MPGHDEVARALCSQLWQLQINRYEPCWHVCFARAMDRFSRCNLHCSGASACRGICRMRLYHRCSGSSAHWRSSNVPHVYVNYSRYIQSLRFLSSQWPWQLNIQKYNRIPSRKSNHWQKLQFNQNWQSWQSAFWGRNCQVWNCNLIEEKTVLHLWYQLAFSVTTDVLI